MRNANKGLGFLVAVLAVTAGSLGWSQATGQGSGQAQDQGGYQGVSHPPADDTITTSTPQEPKPPAGHPMIQPTQPLNGGQPQRLVYPAPQQGTGNTSSAMPMADPRDGTDDGLVGVAPNAQDPRLAVRNTDALRSSDPDGDIVHPEAMRPGMLAEGTMIRVRLIDRLSTATTEKGEPFRTRVATDVMRDGEVLIPAGSEIDGRVADVSRGHAGGYGTMRLQPDMVILPDGSRLRMSADVTSTPGSHTHVIGEGTIRPDSRLKKDGIEYGGAVGAGVVTGAIVGGPVGAAAGGLVGAGVITVHLLVDHPQATLDEGTSLMFMLTQTAGPNSGRRGAGRWSSARSGSRGRGNLLSPARLPHASMWDLLMSEIKTVGVVGAGTMGSGIAHVFARAGFNVVLCDVEMALLEQAVLRIRANLEREAAKGKLTELEVESALERIKATVERDALAGVDFAVEAASERFEIKAEIFRALDGLMAPGAVLATNTSSISIARLAAETGRAEKVIGMHFFNPVPVMALVEVVRGPKTSDATFETVRALSVALGKTPVEVNDAPGFVSNRVLMPLINEAAYAVMEGVATPDAVDQVFKLGMAHPMGPLTLADLIGIDVCVDIMRVLEAGLGSTKYSPCPLLVQMVEEGKLGRKTGRGFYTYGA